MNLFTYFRKTYLISLFAIFFLAISCSQNQNDLETPNRSFDYTAFEFFKSNQNLVETLTNGINNQSKSTKVISLRILNKINIELGTSLSYPELGLDLLDYNREEIFDIALEQGYINKKDIQLNNILFNNLKAYDFDLALSNYEESIINLNLSNKKFNQLNTFINIIKSFNYKYPSLFNIQNTEVARGGWACAGAIFALAAATAGLSSCATIVACGAAILLHLIALDSVARKCKKYLKE